MPKNLEDHVTLATPLFKKVLIVHDRTITLSPPFTYVSLQLHVCVYNTMQKCAVWCADCQHTSEQVSVAAATGGNTDGGWYSQIRSLRHSARSIQRQSTASYARGRVAVVTKTPFSVVSPPFKELELSTCVFSGLQSERFSLVFLRDFFDFRGFLNPLTLLMCCCRLQDGRTRIGFLRFLGVFCCLSCCRTNSLNAPMASHKPWVVCVEEEEEEYLFCQNYTLKWLELGVCG